MEGCYYEDSQEDSLFQFDSAENMVVADSIAVDATGMGLIEDEKAVSDEIVEDTYEKDENASFIEDVYGQEETSLLKVSGGESNGGHNGTTEHPILRGCKSAIRLREVKAKPPLDFDLNELPMAETSPPFSPRVEEIHSFDLNKRPFIDGDEGKPEMSTVEVDEERDFDLNKLPTAGRWKLSDGVDEREFILMVRILLPGCCYSMLLKDSHNCVERTMHHNCSVCFEFLFDTTKDITVLPCPHTIHLECVKEMLQHLQYACPVCSKSYCNMSRVWAKLDREVASTPMPQIYQNKMVSILCNDCGETSEVNFHIVAYKCLKCNSYNTRQTRGGPTSCSSRIEQIAQC